MIDFSFEKRKNFPFNPIYSSTSLSGLHFRHILQHQCGFVRLWPTPHVVCLMHRFTYTCCNNPLSYYSFEYQLLGHLVPLCICGVQTWCSCAAKPHELLVYGYFYWQSVVPTLSPLCNFLSFTVSSSLWSKRCPSALCFPTDPTHVGRGPGSAYDISYRLSFVLFYRLP
jgi:hypothetical protein